MNRPLKVIFCASFLLFVAPLQAQTPTFSSAHQKIAKHFLSDTHYPAERAFWIRHNELVLAVNKTKIDEKEYAKMVCTKLQRFGFGSQDVTIMITEASALRKNQLGPVLSQRRCNH